MPFSRRSALYLLFAIASGTLHGLAADRSPTKPSREAVVLELFTSQGCSSCPPAEALLQRLAKEQAADPRLVTLSYHVDYWDHLGWPDPFASTRWTDRQADYNRALGEDGPYTPELVIDGRAHAVGSDERTIRKAIREAASAPAACDLRVVARAVPDAGGAVEVEVEATWHAGVRAGKLAAAVVLYDDPPRTQVARGENAGRTLDSLHVVRALDDSLRFEASPGATFRGRVRVPLQGIARSATLGVAVLIQDPRTYEVLGALAVPVN